MIFWFAIVDSCSIPKYVHNGVAIECLLFLLFDVMHYEQADTILGVWDIFQCFNWTVCIWGTLSLLVLKHHQFHTSLVIEPIMPYPGFLTTGCLSISFPTIIYTVKAWAQIVTFMYGITVVAWCTLPRSYFQDNLCQDVKIFWKFIICWELPNVSFDDFVCF